MSRGAAFFGLAIAFACGLATEPARAAGRDAVTCAADAESAQSLRQKKKLVDAQKLLVACADASCPRFVRTDCLRWLDEVQATLPTIVVRAAANGQDVLEGNVSIDGAASVSFGIAVPLDPGPHTVAVKSPAGEGELKVLVAEGEKSRVIVVPVAPKLATPPTPATPGSSSTIPSPPSTTTTEPPPEPAQRSSAFPLVLGGVGVVALGVFGGFQIAAQSQYDDLKKSCGRSCAPEDVDEVRTKVTISAVALGVGVVALATGAVLFFTQKSSPRASTKASPLTVHF